MKQDCEKYNECRKPVPLCNGKCPEYKKYTPLVKISKPGSVRPAEAKKAAGY
jgi:predicted RNA-binding protein with PUA domain